MNNNIRPADMKRISTPELAEAFIADQVAQVRAQVGDKKVLLALSGGVDSSVVPALLIKAIGKQLVCVHVNHGLMRKGESEQVIEVFKNQLDANLIYVDATDRFLDLLAGVDEPERKRKIIGGEFIKVFDEEARALEGIAFLAQGTIYPDILESDGVKAHHNVGGLPEDLQFELMQGERIFLHGKTRSGSWAGPWACRSPWWNASPSRGRAWACGAWGPSPGTVWRPCGSPMPFCGRSSARQAWRRRSGSSSPWCRTSGPPACGTASGPMTGRGSSGR